MKLKQYAMVAEIISSIAILVTLVVLVFEIRGNSEAIRSATYQNVSESLTQLGQYAMDRDYLDLYSRGAQNDLDDPSDQRQFALVLVSQVRRLENAYYQREIIGPDLWQGIENAIDRIVSVPGFEGWWNDQGWREVFGAEFQLLVDELREDDRRE